MQIGLVSIALSLNFEGEDRLGTGSYLEFIAVQSTPMTNEVTRPSHSTHRTL